MKCMVDPSLIRDVSDDIVFFIGNPFSTNLRVATRVAGDILHEVLDAARRGMLMPQTLLSSVFAKHPVGYLAS